MKRSVRTFAVLLCSLLIAASITATALAAPLGPTTWYVSNSGSGESAGTTEDAPTTLANAVQSAAAGDTIIVLDNITVESPITLGNSITIKGKTSGETRQKLTANIEQMFILTSNTNVTFEDLIFDGSSEDYTGNSSGIYGGAISADGKTAVNPYENITLTVNNCEFTSFEAYAGGAICFNHVKSGEISVINDSCFTDNKAEVSGGAIGIIDCISVDLNVTNSKFQNNTASTVGGAIGSNGSYSESGEVVSFKIASCEFMSNKIESASTDDASIFGGGAFGIKETDGKVINIDICDTTFTENSTKRNNARGGAIHILTGEYTLDLSGCTFEKNNSTGHGGAINLDVDSSKEARVTVLNTRFEENYSSTRGGAMHIAGGGVHTNISKVLFESNEAVKKLGNAIVYFYSGNAKTTSVIYPTNGAAFKDNGGTLEAGGTIYLQSSAGSDDLVCFADYMIDGTRLYWKSENEDKTDLEQLDREIYADFKLGQYGGSLYLDEDTKDPSYSYDEYSNFFINNSAGQYGGAIFNYGSLTIGEQGEDIIVNKVWDDELEHCDVTVNLVRKSDKATLDSLTLGTASEWRGTFYGFPTNVGYAVTENAVEGYTAQITQEGNKVTVTNSSNSPIIVKPANITIYMGGEEGYGGTVDSSGTITGSSSLPTPGFVFEGLPDGVDPTDISFTGAEGRTWTVELYPGLDENAVHKLYIIVPAAGQEPVRVQFEDGEGNITTSDNFDVGEHVNQTLKMSLYKGGAGTVTAQIGGRGYRIEAGEAELVVRGTSSGAEYAGVNDSISFGKPGLEAPEGTVYYINNSEVEVTDSGRVSLLFDDIIEEAGSTERKDALINRAEKELGATDAFTQRNYEFKYLDLVDRNNGNAWVAASEKVTVYWPLPAGTNRYTSFTLLHFEGLHREMDSGEVAAEIAGCTVDDDYELVVTNTHVIFTIERDGFSPFALVWETSDYPYIPPVTPSEPDYKPEWLNTEDHFAYIIGYEDGTVRPNGSITRAEVATIFFRLLTDETREQYWSSTNNYTDVKAGDWFNNAVSTLSRMGILGGYADGTFRPDATITRAEFAKIAVSFFKYKDIASENIFTDVVRGSWYESFVTAAAEIGLIEGYEDGTFRPDASITRAEACTIINRTLGRASDKGHLLPESEMLTWPDNPESAWYYAQIQEATNSHEYKWLGAIEQWLKKLPERDWAA